MAKDYPTNTGLIATLAAKGIHAQANTPSAPAGKAAQMAADFRAGVRYTPISSGSVHPVYPVSAPASGYTPENTALQSRLVGMGVTIPQAMPGPVHGYQPQPQYNAPMQSFGTGGPFGAYHSWNEPGPQTVSFGGNSFSAQNPWRALPFSPDQQGDMWPSQKPTWMPYSTWALALMDRNK